MRSPLPALTESLGSARSRLALAACAVVLAVLCALPASASALQFIQPGGSPFGFDSEGSAGIATGDLDNDGRDDVVTVNWGSLFGGTPTYAALLANPDGSLSAAPGGTVSLPTEPYRVALGHIDDDGNLDMAMTMGGKVDIYLGNGDGTFPVEPVTSLTTGENPMGVVIADLNGDTQSDVVVANYGSNDVSVFYAFGGGGNFIEPEGSPFPVGAQDPIEVVVGDLDGNGIADIATANQDETGFGARGISVLLGGEGSGYAPAPGSPLQGEYRSADIAIGHIDDGPELDLVTVSNPNNGVVVKLGDGNGGFTDAPGGSFDFPSRMASSLALTDFDDNGRDEVAIPIGSSIGEVANNTVWVFESAADGSLAEVDGNPFPVWPGSYPDRIAAGDFNGDGTPDLVTASDADLTVLLSDDEPRPYPVLEPGWLDFGEEFIGATSDAQGLRIANEGQAVLSLGDLSLEEADADQFSIDLGDCDGLELGPGEECTAEVTFSPTRVGWMSAKLRLPRALGPPAEVTLYGVGEDVASAEMTPSEHDFGELPVGEGRSAPVTFVVRATSEAFIRFDSVSLTGADPDEFEISYDDCEDEFFWEEGEYCEIDVHFNPRSVGAKTAELTVESDDLPEPLTASLSGTGEPNPGILAYPNTWDAGAAPVGTGSGPTNRFTVLSRGGSALEVESVTLGGDDPGAFTIVADDCTGASIEPWDSCEIEVEFVPGSVGPKAATLDVVSNVADWIPEITLEGSGEPNPAAELTPSSHDFGAVPFKTPSAPQAFTLESTGTTPVEVASVQLSDSIDGFEVADDACTAEVLEPGESCAVEVVLNPQDLGSLEAELQIATDAPGSPLSAVLTGSAAANPGIALTPESHEFGDRLVGGGPSESQAFTIENTGTTPVSTGGQQYILGEDGEDFAIIDEDCGPSLEPGETCSAEVAFEPTSAGAKSAVLTVLSDAGEASASLSGTGLVRSLSVSPSSVPGGDVPVGGASNPLYVSLESTGSASVTVESLEFTSGDVSQFVIGQDCIGEIEPGETCVAEASFEPTGLGAQEATLTVVANAPGSPWAVEFTGTGVAAPNISLSPASHDFGNVLIGAGPSASQTFTVESTGSADLNLEGATIVGTDDDAFGLTDSCPATLAPEATCEIQVEYDPTAEGPQSAQLSVASDAPGSPATAGLGGFGIAPNPELGISPSSHDFGAFAVGTQSPSETFTVESTGNWPVTVSGVAIAAVHSGDFAIVGEECVGEELFPGEACDLEVRFEPSTMGAREAALSVSSSATVSPVTASLSGTGTANPAATVRPASVGFGTRTVGEGASEPQAVTIESTGMTPLQIEDFAIEGAAADQFELVNSKCPDSLAPGDGCEVFVAFAPTAAGSHEAELAIATSAERLAVALSGTGEEKPTPPPPTPPAPPAPPAPAPPSAPDCTVPEVKQPTVFVPKVKAAPGAPGLRARFAIRGPVVLEVTAKVHFRVNGKARAASLGKQTLRTRGRTVNYKVAIPARLRKTLAPGTAVRLTLRYRSRGTESACTKFGPAKTRNLATKVVWIKLG